MIGFVNDFYEIVLDLLVYGTSGVEGVSAVVDTGYTGTLTLPPERVEALGLQWLWDGVSFLADGSERQVGRYQAEIDWDGEWRTVIVSAVGDDPLIGTKLLAGHELRAEFTPGGPVELRPLG